MIVPKSSTIISLLVYELSTRTEAMMADCCAGRIRARLVNQVLARGVKALAGCVHVCMYVCMYVKLCIHVCVCVCVHIHELSFGAGS